MQDLVRAQPPRLLVWASAAVIAVCSVLAIVGALQTGVTWDEPYHTMRLQNFFDHGWYALDWSLDVDSLTEEGTNTSVYAPVTMLLLHGLTVLTGVEGWGTVTATPEAYDVRHLGVVLIGLGGVAAASAITRLLLGSWRWGLVTAAVLMALPMWTGHIMFNIKDVPVATGYTVVTLALCSIALARGEGRRWLRVLGLVVGILLMMGTRPAMWAALAAGLVVLVVGLAIIDRRGLRAPLLEAGAGVVVAGLALLALYPNLFSDPSNLLQSAEQSASFRDGRNADIGHIPFYLGTQTPLLLLAFSAIGVVVAIVMVLKRFRTDVTAIAVTLVGAQLLALPLAAIVQDSDLYNALRQLLFYAPAWAIVATIGLARLTVWAHGRVRRVALGTVAIVALVAPVADAATLFPYTYTYYNVTVDLTETDVPSDFWRASVAELLPEIPTDGQVSCSPSRFRSEFGPRRNIFARGIGNSTVDCRTDPNGPLATWWAARDLPLGDTLPRDQFYVVIDRGRPPPVNCTLLAKVERTRHFRDIEMTHVARCELPPPPLDSTPVVFERPVNELRMAPDLWRFAVRGWAARLSSVGVDVTDPTASLQFQTPRECQRTDCRLVLDVDTADQVTVTLNDAPATTTSSGDQLLVDLPAGTSDAWVTLAGAGGSDLTLRLFSMHLDVLDQETP